VNNQCGHTFNRFDDTWTRAVIERCSTLSALVVLCWRAALLLTATPGAERVHPGTLNFHRRIDMWGDDYIKKGKAPREWDGTAFDGIILACIGGFVLWSALYLLYQMVQS